MHGAPGRALSYLNSIYVSYVLKDAAPPTATSVDVNNGWVAGIFVQCAAAHMVPIMRQAAWLLMRGKYVLLHVEICCMLTSGANFSFPDTFHEIFSVL